MAKEKTIKSNKKSGKNFITQYRMIVGIIMLVCSIVLGVLILPNIGNKEYTVYTVKDGISAGTTITTKMLTEVKTSDKKLSELAATTKSKNILNEYMAKHELAEGSYLLWSELMPVNGEGSTDKVPKNKQLISVPVSSIYTTVSYTLRKGDIVRFYSTYEDERDGLISYIPSNLACVEIYEVYDSSGIPCVTSGGAPASFSLIVTEAQALDIVTLMNTSKVYYSLISSGDEAKAEKLLLSQEKVLKGEADAIDELVDMSDVNISGSVDNSGSSNNINNDIYTDGKANAGILN